MRHVEKPLKRFFCISLFLSLSCEAQYFQRSESFFDFKHNPGDSKDFFYPEIVGSGVAVIDYDKDGDLDVYLVQSGELKQESSKYQDKLFRNLQVETGHLKFVDVSKNLEIRQSSYGIGVAIADVNNDGWDDIFLAQLNKNVLLLNQKGKRFIESSRLESKNHWSVSASFCDINKDGLQDLYVANYVQWSPANNPKCYNSKSKRDYCGPSSFLGFEDEFYLQSEDKGLVVATKEFFPQMKPAAGMNVVCRDINSDGYSDFIVANDGEKNLVWLNQEGKSFKEFGLFSGLAVNLEGKPEASMGIATADFDLDGDNDVLLTHLMDETNTLYANSGKGFFQDVSNRKGVAQDSKAFTGWAAGFLHVNDDIYPDLMVFNGAVADTYQFKDKSSLSQPNQLYLNSPQTKFKSVEEKSLQNSKSSRGASFADIDNDGDVDVIVSNSNDKPDVFLNQLNPKKWYGLVVPNPSAYTVILENSETGLKQQISLSSDGSYASANDSRLIVNQAQLQQFDRLRLLKGSESVKLLAFKDLKNPNQYTHLVIE